MKIISFANNKGGVAKTTLTFNIGYIFANSFNKRVLLLDLDHQADLSITAMGKSYYNITETNSIIKAFDMNKNGYNLSDIIYKTDWDMDIIPSEIDLNGYEYVAMSSPHVALEKIKILLNQIKTYDYVFIDCPPSLNLFTQNAFMASDYVIIPTELTRQGLKATNMTLATLQEINPDAVPLKILPIKVNLRTKIQKTYMDLYKKNYGALLESKNYVGTSISFVETMSLRVPFVHRENGHKHAYTLRNIADDMLRQIESRVES